jgi:uncharacterized iron-regulated membrane protein
MKVFRRLLFWCHLIVGVTFGVVVLIMSVTGVLLAYQRQITAWADTRGYDTAPPVAGARRLSVDVLLARVREVRPDFVATSVTMPAGAEANAAVTMSARRGDETLFVNAYTGVPLGNGSPAVRGFFRGVTDWHRWLALQGDSRATGRTITGAANFGFFFLVLSGFYLWFPRTWSWQKLRNVIWFRRGLPGKARDFNWHNTIGIWSLVPLFVIVLSGVVMSYPWANGLVYRAVGEQLPTPGQGGRAGGVTVTYLTDDGRPQNRTQVTIDSKTGAVLRTDTFANYTRGRQVRTWMRFAHTGEFYGVVGQTIAAIASAGAAFLVYTGLSLALRRLWRSSLLASLLARFGRLDNLARRDPQPLGHVAIRGESLEVPLVETRHE